MLADSPDRIAADSSDSVVVLIGEKRYLAMPISQWFTIPRLKAGKLSKKAVAEGKAFIPVRIALFRVSASGILFPLIRVLRYKYKAYSSHIYHINPFEIRSLKNRTQFSHAGKCLSILQP